MAQDNSESPEKHLKKKQRHPKPTSSASKHHYFVHLTFGLFMLLIPLGYATAFPEQFQQVEFPLRVITALGGGLVGSAIPGMLNVDTTKARATGGLAVFLLIYAVNPPAWLASNNDSQPLKQSAASWMKTVSAAREAKTVSPNAPLPVELVSARSAFETSWTASGLQERKRVDTELIFRALAAVIQTHKLEETDDRWKNDSIYWADQAISFFEQIQDRKYLTESLLEKAAIFLDLSQLDHTDRQEFQRVTQQGDQVMSRAYSLADGSQKAEVLRFWSRFYYNLARPQSNNLSEKWSNTYLFLAYEKIRDAYELDPDSMKNVNQLARTTQKLAGNPPQDTDPEWTRRLREVQGKLNEAWKRNKDELSSPLERIPALQILGVITAETALREWKGTDDSRATIVPQLTAEIRNVALPALREAYALLPNTQLRGRWGFDLAYDLARVHAVLCQLHETVDPIRAKADFDEVVEHMKIARSEATATQLDAALQSLELHPTLAGLSAARKHSLREVLVPREKKQASVSTRFARCSRACATL